MPPSDHTGYPSGPAISAGLLAAFDGFTSSFSVILQGLTAVGATHAQAASGLMALSIAMGVCGILVSLRTRMPVSIAWSTPGAALLASSGLPEGGFAVAVGAFLVAALLVVCAGVWRPLGRLLASIPAALANAMLAGILFGLCLAPVKAIAAEPLAGLAVALTWLAIGRIKRLYAVPAAALVAVAMILLTKGAPTGGVMLLPHPIFVEPVFTLASAIGIGLPLFLVTMASQNIPGLAILKINGYAPAPGGLFAATGVFTMLSAPFGGHAVNLAAMTAALISSEEAGRDRETRYWSGVVSGLAYIAFGLGAGVVTAFAALDPLLIQAVAGLALIGAFSTSLQAAMASAHAREAATVTFLVAASGVAVLGISASFLGLVAGGIVLAITNIRANIRADIPGGARPASAASVERKAADRSDGVEKAGADHRADHHPGDRMKNAPRPGA